MTAYRVDLTAAAARQAKKLPHPVRDRVIVTIQGLREAPRPSAAKKLFGEKTAWRIRVGDYRVIYDLFDTELTVTIVRAGHRRDIYKQ